MLLLALALTAQLTNVETVTTDADHFDKYASVVFDREGTMWVAYASMPYDHTSILVLSKRGGHWVPEETPDPARGSRVPPRAAPARPRSPSPPAPRPPSHLPWDLGFVAW